MRNFKFVAVILIILASLSYSGQKSCRFEKGDRVCFIGDSITHSGTYHSLVYLYYATRFPNERIDIYNCGIGGDTAGGVLKRFQWDIEPYKPSTSVVMLGMNDVGRSYYHKGDAAAKDIEARRLSTENYKLNTAALASKLQAGGSRIIFITPSIYDQTADIPCANDFGANDGLGIFADFVKQMYEKDGCGFVDFYGQMGALNSKCQKANPSFTIVGADRIHPGRVGNLVMAYMFLKAQDMPRYVSKVQVDASDGLVFDYVADALPFPVPQDAAAALELVPFTEELNQEILSVSSLAQGDYELFIDDQPIGVFTGKQLGEGINLAICKNTPQYKQAVAVADINEQRRQIEFDLRTILFVEHKMLNERIVEPFDMEKITAALDKSMKQRENSSTYDNYLKKVNLYKAKKSDEMNMRKQIEHLKDLMYTANKPAKHICRISSKSIPNTDISNKN